MQPFFVKLHLVFWKSMQMTDEDLVIGCSMGNSRTQHVLYERFSRRMFGVCLRYTANKEEAEDILQEGFVKVFQAIGMWKAIGPLENWIKKIVINTALDHYRQQNNRIQETELFENSGDGVEPLQQFHAQELLRIIQKLPVGYRTVFNLYAIEGYNHKEIAEMLNVTEGTSKSQYARARMQLVRLLSENVPAPIEKEVRTEPLIVVPAL